MKLILYRLPQAAIVLLLTTAASFALLSAAGGDSLTDLRNNPNVTDATLRSLQKIYGYDQPLFTRYLNWLSALFHGQLGYSTQFYAPVTTILFPRALRTAELAFSAMILAWFCGLTLGIQAARRPGSWLDRMCGTLSSLFSATPQLLLAVGALAIATRVEGLDLSAGGAKFFLAVCVLFVPLLAIFLAQIRACLADAFKQEFVQVARAKGLPERTILWRYVLRPSMGALFSVMGVSLGALLSGAVIVEQALDWQGLGQLSVQAVENRDAPLLMGVTLVAASAVMAGNLLSDLFLRWNDPRVK